MKDHRSDDSFIIFSFLTSTSNLMITFFIQFFFWCNSWGSRGRSQKFWNYSFHCIFSIHDTCYDFNWCESETENDNDAYYANWFSLLLLFSRSRSRHIRHKKSFKLKYLSVVRKLSSSYSSWKDTLQPTINVCRAYLGLV